MSQNNLSALNAALFKQLDRLDSIDPKNRDALENEINRARAVQGIASTIISNGNLVLHAAQASTSVGEAVQVPKGLL